MGREWQLCVQNCKDFPFHAIEAYRRSGVTAPRILSLDTVSSLAVKPTLHRFTSKKYAILKTYLPFLSNSIKSRRLRWIGHVARIGRGEVHTGFGGES